MDNDDLKVVIKAVLEADEQASAKKIQSQLAAISKMIQGRQSVRVGLEIDRNSALQQVKLLANQAQLQVASMNPKMDLRVAIDSQAIADFQRQLSALGVSDSSVQKAVEKLVDQQVHIGKIAHSYKQAENEADKLLQVQIAGTDEIGRQVQITQSFSTENGELLQSVKRVVSEYDKQGQVVEKLSAAEKEQNAQFEKRLKFLDKQGAELEKIRASYDASLNAVKPIKDDSHLQSLNESYASIKSSLDALRNGSASYSAESESQIRKQIENMKLYVQVLKNAEYVATELRTKDLVTVKSIQNENFQRLVQKMENAHAKSEELNQEFARLRAQLDSVGDSKGLTDYLNKFDILDAKCARIREELRGDNTDASFIKKINAEIDNLEQKASALSRALNFDGISTGNTSGIQALRGELQSLLNEYGVLTAKLKSENLSPDAFKEVASRVKELETRFKSATNSAKTFDGSFKSDISLKNFSVQAKAATKNLEALGVQWSAFKKDSDLSKQYDQLRELAKGLDAVNLSNFKSQVQEFRASVKAVGLDTKSFTDSVKNAFVKFGEWFGVAGFTASLVRNVQQSVEELMRIDTILTEISKTSDRTSESLRKLGQNAFDTASQYGRKASDYLLGVQEMSRAGFGEEQSEALSELSVLAQSAGDMTAELANQYLIATNAAYGYQGSVEMLNAVLDGQNQITNRNALDMTELAQATKIVASQAAQSGISIEEMTAAVGTMIATTQQGGEIAARAFKGILMNLRQAKGGWIYNAKYIPTAPYVQKCA